MPLRLPFSIMQETDPTIDMDELECILANLIHQGLIKGYIAAANNKKVLVTAKLVEQAYPAL